MPIPPDWLINALDGAPRGFQARLARAAKLTPDKLSKVRSGERGLSYEEAEAIKMAIDTERRSKVPLPNDQGRAGVSAVERVVARRRGKPPQLELVFFLRDEGFFVFQFDQEREDQLRLELSEAV